MSLTMGTGPLAGHPGGTFNFTLDDAPKHRIFFEAYPRRLRARVGERVVLDSLGAHLLHETGILPVAYVPREDVDAAVLEPSDTRTHCPFKGDASYRHVRVGDRLVEDAVWAYEDPLPAASWLRGFVALDFEKADAWLVEDERVFGHLRDPYHRVDVLETSRPVRVLAGGQVLAETTRAKLVCETGLPMRVYVPAADVLPGRLRRSDTRTVCPYKGEATYWHLDGREDAAWSYESPLPEALKAQGHVCFDAEGVETELAAH